MGLKQEPTVPGLLELAVEEDPNNDRNALAWGGSIFLPAVEESIAMLKRHLALLTATWADERCAPCACWRIIYFEMAGEANGGFSAVGEAPHLRESG
ncbi:MAG: hypothetical protein ACLT9P_03210 [Evtepia gabavorous]